MNIQPELLEQQARDCIVRFTCHFDAHEYVEMEQFFSPTGIWKRAEGDWVGLEGLRAGAALRARSIYVRHVLTNMRVDLVNDHECLVHSYFQVFKKPVRPNEGSLTTPALIGQYHDELERAGSGWKIKFRQASVEIGAG